LMPIQPGDPPVTYASVDLLAALIDYRPEGSIEAGLREYCDWFASYYPASPSMA